MQQTKINKCITMRIKCNPDLARMTELVDCIGYDDDIRTDFILMMNQLNNLYHKTLPAEDMEAELSFIVSENNFKIVDTTIENYNTDGTGSVIITFTRLY